MTFFERLAGRIEETGSILCVGLDPVPRKLPESVRSHDLPRFAFNRRIIDTTHEHVAAYKPNVAFYEDPDGWRALAETIAYADGKNVPLVLDAKRGDVGHTARRYAKLLDPEPWGLQTAAPDAMTVNPYLGEDSLQPFLDRSDKGVFILCRTSNAGGTDLQDRELADGTRVFERVADLSAQWDRHDSVGLVVGATASKELETIRERVPSLPFLVPGVGAQGGDVSAAARAAMAGGCGLVNSSRGIIYAGIDDPTTFDKAAGTAAKRLKEQLAAARSSA